MRVWLAGYIVLIKLPLIIAGEPQTVSAGPEGETLRLAPEAWRKPCRGRPFGL